MKSGSAEPASPCVDVCRVDPGTGLCEGCLRTLEEIARWRELDNAEKWAVLAQLGARRVAPANDSQARKC